MVFGMITPPPPTTHVGLIFGRKGEGGGGNRISWIHTCCGGEGGEGIPRVHTVSVAVSGQRSVLVCTSECLVISCCNMEKKIFSDEEVFEQIKPASRKAYKK